MRQLAIIWLLKDFIRREAAHGIVSGVKDWEVKRHLMGDEWSLSETLSHALKLEAEKAASGPPVRLWTRTSPVY
jgi:hypothetical protein